MKLPLPLMVLALVLAGCASAPEDQRAAPDSSDDAAVRDYLDEFTREKLRRNGADLFCDQAGYRGCYEISRAQCVQQLSDIKDACLEQANRRFPDRMRTAADIDRYVKYYAVCMSLRHVAMYRGEDVKALGTCLKNVQWDKAQRDRSFLK